MYGCSLLELYIYILHNSYNYKATAYLHDNCKFT